MTFGNLNAMYRSFKKGFMVALLLNLISTAGAQTPFTLDVLMKQMARRSSISATFTEEKYIQGFQKPILSKGELQFVAPHKFIKKTTYPKIELLSVEAGQLRLEQDGKIRTLDLKSHPDIANHFEGIQSIMAGDMQALERNYRTKLLGVSSNWTLHLTPSAPRSPVRAMELIGRQADVTTVKVFLDDGDYSIMRMRNTETVQK